MASDVQPRRLIRFGVFEVNLDTGELRKMGSKLRLQEKPFQVLAALLERPGEIITREELQQKLWSSDTFVDFDHGVASAINKVRQALGDPADNPRFVETIPRRGYRFIAPVDASSSAGLAAGTAGQPPNGTEESEGQSSAAIQEEARRGRQRRRLRRVAMVVLGSIVAVLAVWSVLDRPPARIDAPLRKFSILPAEDLGLRPQHPFPVNLMARISPNGKQIAYSEIRGKGKLWIYDFDRGKSRAIEMTEGATGVFWSPDSAFIGFFQGSDLKKVAVGGGLTVPLCRFPGTVPGTGTWRPDGGSIIFHSCGFSNAKDGPCVIWEVAAQGGTPKILVAPSDEEKRQILGIGIPRAIPSDSRLKGLLYFTFTAQGKNQALRVLNLETGERALLVEPQGAFAAYSPTGHILYQTTFSAAGILWALPFSAETLRPAGKPFPVVQEAAIPDVSDDGTLVYVRRKAFPHQQQLVLLDRLGQQIKEAGPAHERLGRLSLSPDGRYVAIEGFENGQWDIWKYDIELSIKTRLTREPDLKQWPMWSPAGDRIVFYRRRESGQVEIVMKRADPAGEEEVLSASRLEQRAEDWSADGKYLIFTRRDPPPADQQAEDIWYLKQKGGGGWDEVRWTQTPFDEGGVKFSPHGDYVVYISDFSRKDEIFVQAFPAGGRTWQISREGGTQPRWSRDGSEIFYVAGDTLYSVPVKTKPTFSAGLPRKLFSHPSFIISPAGEMSEMPLYDVSADGRRFVLTNTLGQSGQSRPVIEVVQNWFAEFRDRKNE